MTNHQSVSTETGLVGDNDRKIIVYLTCQSINSSTVRYSVSIVKEITKASFQVGDYVMVKREIKQHIEYYTSVFQFS